MGPKGGPNLCRLPVPHSYADKRVASMMRPDALKIFNELNLAALSRVAINLIFSCLVKKPNKPKKAKDVKLQ